MHTARHIRRYAGIRYEQKLMTEPGQRVRSRHPGPAFGAVRPVPSAGTRLPPHPREGSAIVDLLTVSRHRRIGAKVLSVRSVAEASVRPEVDAVRPRHAGQDVTARYRQVRRTILPSVTRIEIDEALEHRRVLDASRRDKSGTLRRSQRAALAAARGVRGESSLRAETAATTDLEGDRRVAALSVTASGRKHGRPANGGRSPGMDVGSGRSESRSARSTR